MNFLLAKRKKSRNNSLSNVQVYHNLQFPIEDILGVLYPLFAPFYPYKDLLKMIYTTHHVFVAYDHEKGHPVACALINEVPNGGLYVMLFGVRQTDQGRGTGTFTLERIIEWTRQRGYNFIYLHVHIENRPAIGLYEKVGFRKDQYIPNFYEASPKRPPHGYRMVLPLR